MRSAASSDTSVAATTMVLAAWKGSKPSARIVASCDCASSELLTSAIPRSKTGVPRRRSTLTVTTAFAESGKSLKSEAPSPANAEDAVSVRTAAAMSDAEKRRERMVVQLRRESNGRAHLEGRGGATR